MKLSIFFIIQLFYIASAFSEIKLQFLNDQNIPTGEKFMETEIGGLSGIVFDPKTNLFLAVSDDRSKNNPARFYELQYKINSNKFEFSPKTVVFLKDKTQQTYKKNTIDFEGITLINDQVIISSEGSINSEPSIAPEIIVFKRDGSYIRNLQVSPMLIFSKDNKDQFGARDNLVLEPLSSLPNKPIFLTGTEEALIQDDRISTPSYESTVRIFKYENELMTKSFAYKLDKVPSIPVGGLTVGETGLVDMIMLDENQFLSMERSYLPLAKKSVVKIFLTTIKSDSTDISAMDSIKDKKIVPLEKKLLLNLDEIKDKLSANFQEIDNIEGMCLGPKLLNGNQSIVLVSDNNFSKTQRTQFIVLEMSQSN